MGVTYVCELYMGMYIIELYMGMYIIYELEIEHDKRHEIENDSLDSS
jgi:hypothetical protein